METFDVVVLGGGPAGCACAISLKRQDPALSVAVIESRGYKDRRIGETLPPNIGDLLRHLGVWEAFLASEPLAAHGTLSYWGSESLTENDYVFHSQGNGWHVDRAAFDQMLFSAAERAGACVFPAARAVSHKGIGEGWELTLQQDQPFTDQHFTTVGCSIVVDAAGRAAAFSIAEGAHHVEYDKLAGVFLFFESAGEHIDSRTLVESLEHGWIYSAALPGGAMAAAFLSDTDILRDLSLRSAADWMTLLEHTPQTRKRLQSARPVGNPTTRSAASRQLDAATGAGWIAAGDAASTFDPLSSQGIFKAIRSGMFASYSVLNTLRGSSAGGPNQYEAFVRDEYEQYLNIRSGFYAQEQRWPQAPFWRRRHERITLDPARLIHAPLIAQALPDYFSSLKVTSSEIKMLRIFCDQPRPASEIVQELAAKSARSLTRRRALLAVQELLDRGLLHPVS